MPAWAAAGAHIHQVKLLAVDFSNLLIRHAANPYGTARDSLGRSLQGPAGAISQVLRCLRDSSAITHLLIARDSSRADSVRRDVDPRYKSHRPDTDDDLRRQFTIAYGILSALRWPVVGVPGYEADDVIASAACRFPGRSEIITGDRDLLALCAHQDVRVVLLRPGGSMYCAREECERLFGVAPEQVQNLKALVGDASDGITGVPGIGKKTATRLLRAHGSLADVYRKLDAGEPIPELTAGMQAKLTAGREHARRSWQLARLHTRLNVFVDSLQLPPAPEPSSFQARLRELDAAAVLDAVTPLQ